VSQISLVNNLLKYGLMEMVLRFRRRLAEYLSSQYMKGYTYYQITNTDNRVANPDQLLTQDVEVRGEGSLCATVLAVVVTG
jgi:ATP-binding cassette subfamily D (ALD) protein 3